MQEGPEAAFLRAMAAKCLRLAALIHDPAAIDALRKLAEEYEEASDREHNPQPGPAEAME